MVSLPLRHLFDFEVGSHITTIHVAHGVGLHQHVVEARVENGFLLIGALHVNAAELALPHVVGGLHIVVKFPTFGLGKHILAGAIIINRRNRDFYNKFLIIIWIKA